MSGCREMPLDTCRNMRYTRDMKKTFTSLRISPEAKELLVKLAAHLGISQTAVIELAIRQLAKQEHLKK